MEEIPRITAKAFKSDYVPSEVPTRIAVGVARPKAQGQETTCQKEDNIVNPK